MVKVRWGSVVPVRFLGHPFTNGQGTVVFILMSGVVIAGGGLAMRGPRRRATRAGQLGADPDLAWS